MSADDYDGDLSLDDEDDIDWSIWAEQLLREKDSDSHGTLPSDEGFETDDLDYDDEDDDEDCFDIDADEDIDDESDNDITFDYNLYVQQESEIDALKERVARLEGENAQLRAQNPDMRREIDNTPFLDSSAFPIIYNNFL